MIELVKCKINNLLPNYPLNTSQLIRLLENLFELQKKSVLKKI